MVALLSAWGLCYLLPSVNRRQAALYGGAAAASGLVVFAIASYSEDHRRCRASTRPAQSAGDRGRCRSLVIAVFIADRSGAIARPGQRLHRDIVDRIRACVCILLGLRRHERLRRSSYDVVSGQKSGTPHYPALFAPGGTQAAEVDRATSPVSTTSSRPTCTAPTRPEAVRQPQLLGGGLVRAPDGHRGLGIHPETNHNYVAGHANSTIPAPDPAQLKLNDAAFTAPSEKTIGASSTGTTCRGSS